MTVFIPENKIADIKNAADLVDIISESVLLKKSGNNYLGLCPFHSEKTPSFTVSPSKQIFHCFGCGEGGNIFNFLMKHDGVSFPEAAHMLAKRYGIEIPTESMSPEQKKEMTERERLLNLNKLVMDYYCQNLSNNAIGKNAAAYLAKRQFSQDTIARFRLGYAPPGWDNLVNFLSKKGVPRELALKSGMVITKQNGGTYDRFRNRIIFPIINTSMQVIGFGGRVLDDSLPKYLNSPETIVYNKSRSLYGLDQTKQKCREEGAVYIVEGYMDLLSLCHHGIENAVATLGTALTPEHVRLIKGHIGETGKAILVYDSDEAGITAAKRSIGVFEKEKIDAYIFVLPKGYDPDSYLFEFGAESFKKAAPGAFSIISFLIDSAIKKRGLSIEGKIHIISDLKEPLISIGDSMARGLYVKELSEKINVDESAILTKIRESTADKTNRKEKLTDYSPRENKSDTNQDTIARSKWDKIEKQLIAMLLQFPEMIHEIKKQNVLNYFENNTLKSIGQLILARADSPDTDLSDLISLANDVHQRRIITALAMEKDLTEWDYNGCLKLIAQFIDSRNRNENSLLKQIKEAEHSNNHELLMKLLNEKQILARKKEVNKLEHAGGESL